jgi:accumulation-associated protein
MMTTEKIDKVLEQLKELASTEKNGESWFKRIRREASKKETDEEELEYLEGKLQELRDIKNEELEKETEPQEETPVRLHTNWVMAALLVVCVVVIAFLVLGMFNGKHKANNIKAADSKTVSSLVLPKEEFQVIDYKVDGDAVVYDSSIANTQQKVFANGSKEDSLSANADNAVNEMVQYMSHNATALKEKAMTFGIVDTNADVKDWLSKGKDGNLYYNEKGKDVYYQTKAFLSRSQTSSKKMEEGSNYYATGVNSKGDVVVSQDVQDLSGQQYVEVSNPKGSTETYSYRVLVYCGNTVMKTNNVPGVKTGKVEIPTKPNEPGKPSEPGKPGKPDKPGKPSEPGKPGKPDKPGESKVEKKDPAKDPANQGKAPVGGGKNDGSSNGSETSQASLPEKYSAPAAPSASAPAQSSTPSQDARVSEPSQWSGAGTVTDSNGTTTVADNGAVTTPDNHHYDGLVGQSAPSVEAGANGVTTPSSSANFAGNGSMSEPAIDD